MSDAPQATSPQMTDALHRRCAVDLFNHTWTLLNTSDRSPTQDEEMLHAAHASRHHWSLVGNPVNLARGDWQLARVYAVLGRSEPAHHHALKSLDRCERHTLSAFDHGFAYEAIARALAVAENRAGVDDAVAKATACAAQVPEPGEQAWLIENLDTITNPLPPGC